MGEGSHTHDPTHLLIQSKANEERKESMNEEKEIGIRTLAETVAANAGISRAEAHHVIRDPRLCGQRRGSEAPRIRHISTEA